MKKIITILVFALFAGTLITSCESNASNEVRANGKKGELLGTYRVSLDKENFRDEVDSMDAGGKFVMSLLSLVKVNITFKENGYAFFDGEFGFLDFDNKDSKDSVRYWIENNHLFLDDVEIETEGNDDDSFSIVPLENGAFQLEVDSLTLFLRPIQ